MQELLSDSHASLFVGVPLASYLTYLVEMHRHTAAHTAAYWLAPPPTPAHIPGRGISINACFFAEDLSEESRNKSLSGVLFLNEKLLLFYLGTVPAHSNIVLNSPFDEYGFRPKIHAQVRRGIRQGEDSLIPYMSEDSAIRFIEYLEPIYSSCARRMLARLELQKNCAKALDKASVPIIDPA